QRGAGQKEGRYVIVCDNKYIMRNNIDFDISDGFGRTPLHWVAHHCLVHILQTVLQCITEKHILLLQTTQNINTTIATITTTTTTTTTSATTVATASTHINSNDDDTETKVPTTTIATDSSDTSPQTCK
ncbi:cryptopsoridial mucin, large thr stretch, signal peptide sequence, partial [Reticulomyxa filosa]